MVSCRRFALPLLVALLAAAATSTAQEYSVVGGTVFRDSGLALPDAEVTLEVAPEASATALKSKSKGKKLKAVSSPRGEFTFRVPPRAARYRVAVTAKGYQPAEKVVEIQGAAERVDATFSLAPESKH